MLFAVSRRRQHTSGSSLPYAPSSLEFSLMHLADMQKKLWGPCKGVIFTGSAALELLWEHDQGVTHSFSSSVFYFTPLPHPSSNHCI